MSTGKGQEFEKILEQVHASYAAQGRARIEKTTPPTLIIRPGGGAPRLIPLENPFLDFVGAWKEHGGMSLHIEAKRTQEPRLAFNSESGIKVKQMENLLKWQAAGSAVCVLWGHRGDCRMVSINLILAAKAEGRKSVAWAEAYPLFPGDGLVLWDYLTPLKVLFPLPMP